MVSCCFLEMTKDFIKDNIHISLPIRPRYTSLNLLHREELNALIVIRFVPGWGERTTPTHSQAQASGSAFSQVRLRRACLRWDSSTAVHARTPRTSRRTSVLSDSLLRPDQKQLDQVGCEAQIFGPHATVTQICDINIRCMLITLNIQNLIYFTLILLKA